MVSEQTRQRKAVIILPTLLTAFMAGFLINMIVVLGLRAEYEASRNDESTYQDSDISDDEIDEKPEEEIKTPKKIDFQTVVDEWAGSVGGKKGVIIYDLDLNETVGEYNADTGFATASLYKLFVVYEGYRKLERGEWEANTMLRGTGHTTIQCLDLAIRESDSACAETLWSMIGRETLDAIAQQDLKVTDFTVGNLTATPREIMQMLKIYYWHTEVTSATLVARMQDSFLNQPATTYDWRQGLPKGFSDRVLVYNKVGWNYDADEKRWTIYDDAAIVDFVAEGRHFAVVVMTSGVDYKQIRNFGASVEAYFYEQQALVA